MSPPLLNDDGLGQLRAISLIEACSYMALLAAMVLKYSGSTAMGVSVLGPVHGILYLIFVAVLVRDRLRLGFDWGRTVVAAAIGSLPLGGFWLERTWFAQRSSHDDER